MIYIGVDPGKSGGITAIADKRTTAHHILHIISLKKMPDTESDIWNVFFDLKINYHPPFFALIEKVHAMPKQGVTSTFTFGRNYGFLRACLIGNHIPFDEVAPQKWQKALGCLSKGDKNVTKAKAQQLFPAIKKQITHATADSLLIAEYARRRDRND